MEPGLLAQLDAVTLDANGTLLRLVDPVESLSAALAERGIERGEAAIRAAFEAEVAYYLPRTLEGRDPESLGRLRLACTGVFLHEVGAAIEPASFVDAFAAAVRFQPFPGIVEELARLRAGGLELAVVSNWDFGLSEHLERAGFAPYLSAVVSSAEAGAAKPDPAIFGAALEQLGVEPERALHVGDSVADAEGAAAAGMRFARAPLAEAIAGLS